MLLIDSQSIKFFKSAAAAEAAIETLGFDDGELRVAEYPKGYVIEVIDLDDGAVIGTI